MTTIAYNHKDKEIAVDSRCTSGTLIVDDKCSKVFKQGGVTFIGGGELADLESLIAGYPHGFEEPVTLNAQAFVVFDGEVYMVRVDKGEYKHDSINHNSTLGSGGDFALAAMDFGKSAKEAVKYAATRDCATGGRIKTIKVK